MSPPEPAAARPAAPLPERALHRALPFLVAAAISITAGGVLAAATAYVTTQKTAWATAYIVLVMGVAQAGIGAAMGWLAQRASMRAAWIALVLFNLGSIGVLAGQLTGVIALTFAGGALLVAALVMIVAATRGGSPAHPVLVWSFRILVVVLAVSIPVGLLLALITH
ncbi:MAG TPA: hypothetical protein VFN24_13730 [Microbacterium sp.]|nr:hypothetical protein [Microbacterium sp.]